MTIVLEGAKSTSVQAVLAEVTNAVSDGKFTNLPSNITNITAYLEEVFSRNQRTNKAADDLTRDVWYSDTYALILEFISVKDESGFAIRDDRGVFHSADQEAGVEQFTWLFLQGVIPPFLVGV